MATMTSTIYLCRGVPLSNRYDHTLYFANSTAQRAYFDAKVDRRINDVSYLRKSWSIQIDADMDTARCWSYLFFQHLDTGKTWYYFVTDVEYINDRTVKLDIELDVLQSYLFDWKLNRCFVEREHVKNDSFGLHTVDEGLDTGDLIVCKTKEINWDDLCVLVLTTVEIGTSGYPNIYASRYNGVFGGAAVFAVNMTDWQGLGLVLDNLSNAGKIDAVISMFMYPKALVTLADGETWSNNVTFKKVSSCNMQSEELFFNSDLDVYKPKNNKCLIYPFNFIYATNNVGGAAVYRYEHFGNHEHPHVNLLGTLSAEGVAYMYPLNYKGVQHHYDEGLQLGGLPTCAWNADVYKLWLAQNQNQHQAMVFNAAFDIAVGAGAVAAGLYAGSANTAIGGAASIRSGVQSIQMLMAQKKDMAIQPPQARGNHSGSLNMTAGQVGYTFYGKCVDNEHARCIDDFFSMYGYAVHRVKVPSLKNRPSWTYIKTRDSNVTGDIPHADLTKINQIFDAGVTWWATTDIGNYALDNSPAAS